MIETTYIDRDRNIVVHYDAQATGPVTRFTVWNEGDEHVVVAEPGETSAQAMGRVHDELRRMRSAINCAQRRDPEWKQSGFHRGAQHRAAHVYAGIEPTREQVASHMKDWITWMLYQIANPRLNKNGTERVAALCALADLYGLSTANEALVLPTREQLAAELARRAAVRGDGDDSDRRRSGHH